jgi:hypothetical protein
MQGHINRLTAAKFQKIDWHEDRASIAFSDRGYDL